MSVYLLHLNQPFGHATHVGWSEQIARRIEHHRAGRGSAMLRAFVRGGGTFQLARTWLGATKRLERRIKRRDYGPIAGLCPLCSGEERDLSTLRRECRARRPGKT